MAADFRVVHGCHGRWCSVYGARKWKGTLRESPRMNYLIHRLYTKPGYNNRIKCEIASAKSLSRIRHLRIRFNVYAVRRIRLNTRAYQKHLSTLRRTAGRLFARIELQLATLGFVCNLWIHRGDRPGLLVKKKGILTNNIFP